jgi:pimeloyl-ACP methyl ester carboxylesterase
MRSCPRRETGDAADPRPPVVFLHGLAGDRLAWEGLQDRTDPAAPNHRLRPAGPWRRARDWPVRGHAGIAARAVRQSLDRLGIARFHLVGHSMGGAVACLVAMAAPDGVASLTPAGAGRLWHRDQRPPVAPLCPGPGGRRPGAAGRGVFSVLPAPVPDGLVELMAAMRAEPGRTAAFGEIAEAILDGRSPGQARPRPAGRCAVPGPRDLGRQRRRPAASPDGCGSAGLCAPFAAGCRSHAPHRTARSGVAADRPQPERWRGLSPQCGSFRCSGKGWRG